MPCIIIICVYLLSGPQAREFIALSTLKLIPLLLLNLIFFTIDLIQGESDIFSCLLLLWYLCMNYSAPWNSRCLKPHFRDSKWEDSFSRHSCVDLNNSVMPLNLCDVKVSASELRIASESRIYIDVSPHREEVDIFVSSQHLPCWSWVNSNLISGPTLYL